MADPLGVSFSPLDTGQAGTRPGNTSGSPLQDAIKILSFRMPTVVGAQGVSPLAADPADTTASDWLKNIFKGLLPPSQPGAPGQPVTPPFAPPVGPSWTGAPTGAPPPAPPAFGGAPPPGPTPQGAPDPIITTTPPGTPKIGLPNDPQPPVSQAPNAGRMPQDGPPDYNTDPQGWKDWMTGNRFR